MQKMHTFMCVLRGENTNTTKKFSLVVLFFV